MDDIPNTEALQLNVNVVKGLKWIVSCSTFHIQLKLLNEKSKQALGLLLCGWHVNRKVI